MKNLSFLLVVLLLSLILFSCDKDETREFSCDPCVDKYVKENRLKLAGIGIFELASYDIEVQRAIFRSWDYQKKKKHGSKSFCLLWKMKASQRLNSAMFNI